MLLYVLLECHQAMTGPTKYHAVAPVEQERRVSTMFNLVVDVRFGLTHDLLLTPFTHRVSPRPMPHHVGLNDADPESLPLGIISPLCRGPSPVIVPPLTRITLASG